MPRYSWKNGYVGSRYVGRIRQTTALDPYNTRSRNLRLYALARKIAAKKIATFFRTRSRVRRRIGAINKYRMSPYLKSRAINYAYHRRIR